MSVRGDQLVYRAGGAPLERFGTLRKRTAGFEEVVETYARASTAAVFDRNGVLRLAEVDAVRVSFMDLDGDDVRETLAVPMEGALTQLVEHAIPGGSEADFELVELDAVTDLSGEYAIRIEAGDDLQITMPANWDPDSWTISAWFIPDFANTDGVARDLCHINLSGTDRVILRKETGGELRCYVTAGGVTVSSFLTKAFTAGTPVFFGARWDGVTQTAYADTNDDGTLETDSDANANAITAGSYTAFVGQSSTGLRSLEGALNLLVTNDGSSADPITDRFNAGAGMAIEEWANRHSDKLVLYGPHSTDSGATHSWKTAYGSVPAVTRNDTATQITWDDVEAVAANVLRNRHRLTTNDSVSRRVTLLEMASANGWTYAEDITQAVWTKDNISIAADAVAAPDGQSTADKVVEAATTDNHRFYRAVPSPSDNKKSTASVFVKAAERTVVYLRGDTKAAAGGTSYFDLGTGTVTPHASHSAWITAFSDGWYKCSISYDLLSGASAPNVVFGLTTSVGVASYAGDGSSGAYFWGMDIEVDQPVPSSYIPTSGSTDTRAADSLTVDLLDATPQEANYLYEAVVLDLPNTGTNKYLWQLGENANQMLCYFHASTSRLVVFTTLASAIVSGYWTVSLSLGDHIAIRWYRTSAGANTLGLSINGGAEDTTLDGAISTQALPASWGTNSIAFASAGLNCNSGLISFKAQSGAEMTLAELQALVSPDIAVYRSGQTSELATQAASTATKGTSLPGLSGFGNAVGVANATIVDWDSEASADPDAFDVAMASSGLQRVTKFDTGPSGTAQRAYRWGLSGQLNGLTPGSWYSMVVGVIIRTGGAVTAANVTLKAKDDVGTTTGESMSAKGAWQWLHVQRQIDAGATEAYFDLSVEDAVAFGTANAYVYIAMPTIVAGRVRPLPIPNDAEGTVAKAAETNVDAYVIPSSRELTWYLYFVETGQAYATNEGVLSRIDDGSTDPGLRIFAGGAQRYRVEYDDGTTVAEVALSPSVALGQEVEVRVHYVPSTGVITAGVSVDGGAETTGTDTGRISPPAWSGASVRKGPSVAFGWIDEKIALGSHDMTSMREAS
jgi:hypothetical protein